MASDCSEERAGYTGLHPLYVRYTEDQNADIEAHGGALVPVQQYPDFVASMERMAAHIRDSLIRRYRRSYDRVLAEHRVAINRQRQGEE